MQARLHTLQQLYLKSSRTLPPPPDAQATREQRLAAAIAPHMLAQGHSGSPARDDEPILPPRDIVHALHEIAALQKERAGLKAQVTNPGNVPSLYKLPQAGQSDRNSISSQQLACICTKSDAARSCTKRVTCAF